MCPRFISKLFIQRLIILEAWYPLWKWRQIVETFRGGFLVEAHETVLGLPVWVHDLSPSHLLPLLWCHLMWCVQQSQVYADTMPLNFPEYKLNKARVFHCSIRKQTNTRPKENYVWLYNIHWQLNKNTLSKNEPSKKFLMAKNNFWWVKKIKKIEVT